jgi:hypothetical protein
MRKSKPEILRFAQNDSVFLHYSFPDAMERHSDFDDGRGTRSSSERRLRVFWDMVLMRGGFAGILLGHDPKKRVQAFVKSALPVPVFCGHVPEFRFGHNPRFSAMRVIG